MTINELIISNLTILLKEAQISKDSKDVFRARAYRNALKTIKSCDYDLTSGKEALKLNGIGAKIADKIQEIIDTGKLHQVSNDNFEQAKVIDIFTTIWGVGPVKAEELWNNGARTIKNVQKEFYHLLNDNQKIGLKYYNDLQKRVDRNKVELISKKIIIEIKKIEKELKWKVKSKVCGSFRRGLETCGDMDILLCEINNEPILEELVNRLTIKGILIEQLGLGKTKYLGITQTSDNIAFRIDMEVIKLCEWPFAMLYFTGSGSFNEKQRLVAKKMGYSLSEHGLKNVKTGDYLKGIDCERDIFEFLSMKYLSPKER